MTIRKLFSMATSFLGQDSILRSTTGNQGDHSTNERHENPKPIINEDNAATLRNAPETNLWPYLFKKISPNSSIHQKPRIESTERKNDTQDNSTSSLAKFLELLQGGLSFLHSDREKNICGIELQKAFVTGLDKINNDEDILYLEDLIARPNAHNTIEALKSAIKNIGFKEGTDIGYYRYTGEDPAQALRDLEKTRPLIFDCLSSLHFVKLLALLDTIGPDRFNRYIKSQYDGVLSIDPTSTIVLVGSQSVFYQNRSKPVEAALPTDLKIGDHIWIQGPPLGICITPHQ